jgi:hypothetical protein
MHSLQLHDWYVHGDCAVLAFAVNDLTGWPIVFCYNWPCSPCPVLKHGSGPHMLVRHPTGQLLDIDGLHDDPGNMMEMRDAIANGIDVLGWQAEGSVHGLTRAQVTMDALTLIQAVGLTGEES